MNLPTPFSSSLRACTLMLALGGAALGAANFAPVSAQPAGPSAGAKAPVSVELQAFKVVRDADGKE